MDNKTIKKLNKVNEDFYKKIGENFDSSRQYYWDGWDNLWDFIIQNQISTYSILDLACGNARFYKFLSERREALCHADHETVKYDGSIIEHGFAYTGLDNSGYLLSQAIMASSVVTDNDKTSAQLFCVDVLTDDIDFEGKYDLVTAFGFVHHIPSYEKRLEFFKKLKSLVNEDGIICLSIWKFMDDEKESSKVASEEVVKDLIKDLSILEENDYFLSWKRGEKAYRYCHFVNDSEEKKLIQECGLKVLKEYSADGKSGKLNKYLILSI